MTLLTQKTLDAQQAAIARALKLVRGVATVANKAADELCANGSFGDSHTVGEFAVRAERIAADLNKFYRDARLLEVTLADGDVIRPKFGDK